MKRFTRNTVFILMSVVLVSLIFGTGFYFGNTRGVVFNGNVNAAEIADLSSFWRVWNILDDKFVGASTTQQISDEEKVYGAIEGLIKKYDDPYTVFFPPVENKKFNGNIQGNFEGVGMEISIRDGALTVVAPLKDTPVERAGVKSGDKVISIDDITTVGLSTDEAVNMIRGERGTTVNIEVIREDVKDPIKITLTREIINLPIIETELRKDGVFVISLFSFSARSEESFRQALREFLLSKTNKLVLDLRGNPGGYLDAAVDISSWFLPAGKVVAIEDFGANSEQKIFRSKGYNVFNKNLKMVVLIDQGSASASEIVAGALRDHNIAELVGVSSFGKGSVQELIDVTKDTSIKVTIARWLTPKGKSISDGGLTPDIEVKITKEDVDAEKDPQLEKAVELLLK